MIYSRDDVKRMLQTIRELPKYDTVIRGSYTRWDEDGDCNCHIEVTKGAAFVRTMDLDKVLEKIESTI